MSELTREEVIARLDSLETRMEARAGATDAKIDAVKNSIELLKADMKVRSAESDSRMQKNFIDMIKWMVGTAIAIMAVGVTFLIFLFGNFTPK